MRLVFVLSSLNLSGGVLLVIDYANRLAQRGHTVAVVHPADACTGEMLAALHPFVGRVASSLPLEAGRSAVGKLRLAGSLACALPAADVLIATHTPTVLPVLLRTAARRSPKAAWLYMDYDEMFAARPAERLLLHWGPRCFDLIMPISRPLAETARRAGAKRVVVTGSGLARAERFQPRALLPPPTPDGKQRIFYVGDERPRKGLPEALEALRLLLPALPALELVIASKRALVLPPNLPCELHIQPDDEQLANLYRSSRLFVSASWGEGLGYPPLEAMACGVPAVITDSVGVRDYARDEENCLLVPPRNAPALAQAIRRLLDDPALAARLAQAGLQTAAGYGWDAVIDRCEAALRALL